MKKNALFFILVFILQLPSFAQTIINDKSEVYGIWDASHSPYLINGEAIVPEDQTLIIKPGTRIEFKVGTNHEYVNPLFDLGFLRVQGTLQVEGKPDSMVIFTRQGESGNWGMLFFDETASDSSYLHYAKIEYASHIKYLQNWLDYYGAVSIVSAPVHLQNCQISHNLNDGLYIKSANLQLINCLINNNQQNGIRSISQSNLQITNCTIVSNGAAGLDCGINSQPLIVNSIFYFNQKDFEIGKFSLLQLEQTLLQSSSLPDQAIASGKIFLAKPPLFVDPSTQNYHLAANSPAVNSGLADTTQFTLLPFDLEGGPRIAHERIDLGALERQGDFLRIEAPNGNESWLQSTSETIRWVSNLEAFNLDFSADGGSSWQNIASLSGGEKSFTWLIPNIESENCLLRIADPTNPSITDQSDTTFIISDHLIIRQGLQVSGTWPAMGSPVEVRGPAYVPEDSTLTIEPGVRIHFSGRQHFDFSLPDFDVAFLQVKGHLQAIGTENDSIIFTTVDADGHWGGLVIEDQDSLQSQLTFTRISKAHGIDSLDGQNFPAALSLTGAKSTVKNVKISENARNALLIKGNGNHFIDQVQILKNGQNGILLSDGDRFPQPEISNSVIRHNGRHGIFVDGVFSALIHDNLISHNDSTGIELRSGFALPQIVNNRLGYQQIGIDCQGASGKLVVNVIYHCNKGLILESCSPDIGNLTLADNQIAIWGHSTSSVMTNILFSGNGQDFVFPAGDNSAPAVSYSLTDKYYFSPPVQDYGFNRYATKARFSKKWPHYYALSSGSAAIDNGTLQNSLITLPQFDVAGKPRILDGNNDGTEMVDIGAYEYALLKADFKASPTAGKVPLKVNFSDQSKGDIDHYFWDFGDGQTDTVQNPQHVYQLPGRFDVQLIVSGKAGADTLLRQQYIYTKYPPQVCQPAPDVQFAEDSDWRFVGFLDSVFCDPDSTSELSFSVSTSTSNLLKSLRHDSVFVKGKTNFFGTAKIFLKAQDPIYLSAYDTVQVTFLPVNDPPYLEQPLPDSIAFVNDSSDSLLLWDYFADIESTDSLLQFAFQAFSDSLVLDFNTKTGWLKLSALNDFHGRGWLWITVSDDSAATIRDSILVVVKTLTTLGDDKQTDIPNHYYLTYNFPNPFNPVTNFELGLPQAQNINLTLFDLRGRAIHSWKMGPLSPGRHRIKIDANQLQLASGVYFLHLKSQRFQAVRKLILLK